MATCQYLGGTKSAQVTRVTLQIDWPSVFALSFDCSVDMVIGVSSSPGLHITSCVSKERRIWRGALRSIWLFPVVPSLSY